MGIRIRRLLIDEISYSSNYPPSSSSSSSSSLNLNDKISPSVLIIIIILAVVFFVSGLLHLLVRFLWRPETRDPDDLDNVTALQGQLQQLFHLHDSGVDQSFIDTLPVFPYNSIIGINDPFDCAVCLCEFEPEDKLRLLPRCSHAFHVDCIDTWLLSHSTCPLCRNTLLADFSSGLTFPRSPVVFVLESGESDTSREIVVPPESDDGEESESGSGEVVTVKLGKFRGGGDDGGGEGDGDAAARRCFSMGSFAYVMEENSLLRVPIRAQIRKKAFLPLTPGHKAAMSECDGESRRELGFSGLRERNDLNREKGICGNIMNRKESYSVSKIWLRGGKKNDNKGIGDERRAVSFRFPLQRNVVMNNNEKSNGSSMISEMMEMGKWENGEEGGRVSVSEEGNQSWNSLETRAPSFARRTLLWLTGGGRQNKLVHSSSSASSNIAS